MTYNAGSSWSKIEVDMIVSDWHAGRTIEEMVQRLMESGYRRTYGAISKKLSYLRARGVDLPLRPDGWVGTRRGVNYTAMSKLRELIEPLVMDGMTARKLQAMYGAEFGTTRLAMQMQIDIIRRAMSKNRQNDMGTMRIRISDDAENAFAFAMKEARKATGLTYASGNVRDDREAIGRLPRKPDAVSGTSSAAWRCIQG